MVAYPQNIAAKRWLMFQGISPLVSTGGVEDTTFEAKGSKKKKERGQGPTFRGQILARPRTKMVEAKAKDRRYNFSQLWSVNFL